MNIDIDNLNTKLKSEYAITVLSNASSYLFMNIEDINWCGFYILQNDKLILGPFQGKPACDIIPLSKGVCGYCARERKTVIVDNVHNFPGHIACDSESNSEIVVPLFKGKELFGLLDIDSKRFSRFSEDDKVLLEKTAKVIENIIVDCKKIEGII